MTSKELENRLIKFCVEIIGLWPQLEGNYAGKQLSQQMTRASISAPLNYGEAQLAESKKDFIHKVKLVLKELKEVNVALKICFEASLLNRSGAENIYKESNELVAIFVKTSNTARRNQ